MPYLLFSNFLLLEYTVIFTKINTMYFIYIYICIQLNGFFVTFISPKFHTISNFRVYRILVTDKDLYLDSPQVAVYKNPCFDEDSMSC